MSTGASQGAPSPETLLASATPSPTAAASPSPTLASWPPRQANPASAERVSPSPFPSPLISPSAAACTATAGRIETGQFDSALLDQPLEYRVYLPPCYNAQPGTSYPVLYLIHGQGSTDDQWDRLGVDNIADALIVAGEVSPFLIVMPRDRVWLEPTRDRFGEAVVGELIPLVDNHYRTLRERRYRAVGGLSRGGAWAIHLGLQSWQMFGTIGVHSGFVFHTDVSNVRVWLAAIPAAQMPRIYLDLGNNDDPEIAKSAVWFEQLLMQNNIPHEWHLFVGFHEEAYWQAHVEAYLRWYARDW